MRSDVIVLKYDPATERVVARPQAAHGGPLVRRVRALSGTAAVTPQVVSLTDYGALSSSSPVSKGCPRLRDGVEQAHRATPAAPFSTLPESYPSSSIHRTIIPDLGTGGQTSKPWLPLLATAELPTPRVLAPLGPRPAAAFRPDVQQPIDARRVAEGRRIYVLE